MLAPMQLQLQPALSQPTHTPRWESRLPQPSRSQRTEAETLRYPSRLPLGSDSASRPSRSDAALSACLLAGCGFSGGMLAAWRVTRKPVQRGLCFVAAKEQSSGKSLKDEEWREAEAALEALEAQQEALEELEEFEEEMLREVDELVARAPPPRTSRVSTSKGAKECELGRVLVCGAPSGVGQLLVERLSLVARAEPRWMTLEEACRSSFEDLDDTLADCETVVLAPDVSDEGAETWPLAKTALKALLSSCDANIQKVVLLSRADARKDKGGFDIGSFFQPKEGAKIADIEDELTSAVRRRSSQRKLRPIIIRSGTPISSSDGMQVRCTHGDGKADAKTSPAVASEALFQALALQVDVGFTVSEEPGDAQGAAWDELLLPFIGPEVWRKEIPDATRAVFFVQGWAEEFYREGKNAKRHGVKTPVRVQNTPGGVIFKFCPIGTSSDIPFEELKEGGVEFVVEEPEGLPKRIRACRCAYGWKVSPKENSESALLKKLSADWQTAFPA